MGGLQLVSIVIAIGILGSPCTITAGEADEPDPWEALQAEATKIVLRALLEELTKGRLQKFEEPLLQMMSSATGYPVEELRRVQESGGMEALLRESIGDQAPGDSSAQGETAPPVGDTHAPSYEPVPTEAESLEPHEAAVPESADSFRATPTASDGSAGHSGRALSRMSRASGRPQGYERIEHVTGVSLWHPADWSNRDRQGGITLVPSDAHETAAGPAEMYVLTIFTVPADARASVDQFVASAERYLVGDGSTFTRVMEPEWLDGVAGGRMLLRYDSVQGDGRVFHAYVQPHETMSCALMAIGDPGAIAADAPTTRTVFDSIEYAPGLRDAALAGAWFHTDSYTSSGFSMATNVTLELGADGSFARSSRMAGGTADTGLRSDGEVEIGTWFAGNGSLVLLYTTGETVQFQYSFLEGRLATVDEGGRRRSWGR